MKRSVFKPLAWALLAMSMVYAGCATSDDILVNREEGYLYGYASGKTEESAIANAFDDFMYRVLTETGSIPKERKSNVTIYPEIRQAFEALKLQPFNVDKKSDTNYQVVFRIDLKDWNKAENARLAGLQTDLGGRFEALKKAKGTLQDKAKSVDTLLLAIEHQGVVNSLKDSQGNVLYQQLVAWGQSLVDGITWSLNPAEGMLEGEAVLELSLKDRDGKPLAALPVKTNWLAGKVESDPVAQQSDTKGKVVIKLPEDRYFRNQKLDLRLAGNFASLAEGRSFLASLDAKISGTNSYTHNENLLGQTSDEVRIPGGKYTIGAVGHDRRAGSIEKPREVSLAAFRMDRNLVTNRQYLTYLEATKAPRSAYPDYWDNNEFNQPDQPVIGVSLEDAKNYARWLSGVLGYTKRLPTEAEYEVAARQDKATIYPWGDEPASDGPRANYKGNGKFAKPSPVGSFAKGANALGLNDMVGNVWEWTTSLPEGSMSGNQEFVVVKGGSWMDGPNELRISNRMLRDPSQGFGDVGFRLVREAGDEAAK